jgi:nicotinamidase-related amidase
MRPALVVVDVQRRFFRSDRPVFKDLDTALEIINHVATAFRAGGAPVIWVQDREDTSLDDPGYALLDGLDARPADARVSKIASNAFVEDELPAVLSETGADLLVLCGYRAEGCVLATARGAADRGIPYALLRDAVISHDADAPGFVERISPIVSHEIATLLPRPR